MTAIWSANVLAWGLQVAALATLGLLLPAALRISAPRVRLTYLRALLLVCLALPFVQPRLPVPAVPVSAGVFAPDAAGLLSTAADTRRGLGEAPASRWLPPAWGPTLLTVYVAGLGGRLVWMGIGLLALARLRRTARILAPIPPSVEEASLLAGTRAEWRVSDRVVRPATFGLRRPVVLVPPQFDRFAADQQTAVALHELLHVRRRDWLMSLADGVLVSIFWFHPAFWWLVEQIHLSVEQVVDRDVVARVGARRPYLEALLKLATAGPGPLLQPASLFLKHGHLAQRVALLVREVSMSRLRLAASSAVVLGILLAGGYAVVHAWPLLARPEAAPVSDTVSARPVGVGDVVAPLAPSGEQAKVTVDPKAQAKRPGMPVPPPPPPPLPNVQYDPAQAAARLQMVEQAALTTPGDPAAQYTLGALCWERSYRDTAMAQADRQVLAQKGLGAIEAALRIEPTYADALTYKNLLLRHLAGFETDAAARQTLLAQADAVRDKAAALRAVQQKWDAVPPNAIRVGGNVKPPVKTRDMKPVYPAAAMESRVQGVVILEVLINEDGKVGATRMLRSIPLFDDAATQAVRQWEFTPTLLNGAPVPVVMTVTLGFSLHDGAPMPPPPPPPPPPAGDKVMMRSAQAAAGDAVRVGGSIRPPERVKYVQPVYPPEAKEAGIQGIIIIEAVIGPDGRVRDTTVVRSVPVLDAAAVAAVRQWEFAPTEVDGRAVPVIMTLTVNFTLK